MTAMLKKIHLKIDDIDVYIFHAARRRKVTREVWEPIDFINVVNNGSYRVEFIYKYTGYQSLLYKCWFGLIKNHGIKNVKLLFLQIV